MDYTIRELRSDETPLLDDFLYEAIFIPQGVEAPPKSIIEQPDLQVYLEGFGARRGDIALVAQADDKPVGAAWVRIMDDYGHVDDETPSLAISLYPHYRNRGIGTALLKALLAEVKSKGFERVSLAVQKENYAVSMYESVGFETIDENDEEFIMVCQLRQP